jgi:modulator of FtsH protease HflK
LENYIATVFHKKRPYIDRHMMKKIQSLARATALFAENKGPWGGRGSAGSGGKGDGDGEPGGGPRNPWSQPPGGGQRPKGPRGASAMDQFSEMLRGGFGGGGNSDGGSGGGGPGFGGWPAIRLGLLLFAGLWIFFTCVWRISPQERGIVTTFGAYSRTLESGIGLTLPWPIEKVKKLDVTNIRTLTIPNGTGTNFVLTGDQNIIDLDYSVRWSISDPELYEFQIVDQEKTIRDVADSAMRATISLVGKVDSISAQRSLIEKEVERRMRAILQGYRAGIRVEGVAISRTDPPAQVNDAFKAVTAAQQEAQSMINNANAEAQQVKQRAIGEATAFDKVYDQYKLAPGVTRRRMYYETMEEVLSKIDKTIVETGGVTPYLPLPELKRRMPEPPEAAIAPAATGGVK